MKTYFGILAKLTLVLSMTGCAQVALYHDRADPCQGEHASPERRRELGRPDNYKNPDYCFSAGRRLAPVRITDPSGRTVGYIR